MHKTTQVIGCSGKKLRLLSDQHFISIPMKVKKADVASLLVNGILEAGTLITGDGKAVTSSTSTTDAKGIVYQDVDFNNLVRITGSDGDETAVVPVLIHGTVYESEVKLNATEAIKKVEKEALNMIYFGA